jgi:hypothetical protein
MNFRTLSFLLLPLFIVDQSRPSEPFDEKKSRIESINCHNSEILEFSKQYEIDPALLAAIILIESNCKYDAVGLVGEQGLGQIREEFWGEFLKEEGIEDIKSVQAVAAILSYHVKKWGLEKGIERYNGQGERARRYREKVLKKRDEIASK